MTYLVLNDLPLDHPARAIPLRDQKAQCRNVNSSLWRVVEPQWAIAPLPYNSLTDSWTAFTQFRVPSEGAEDAQT